MRTNRIEDLICCTVGTICTIVIIRVAERNEDK